MSRKEKLAEEYIERMWPDNVFDSEERKEIQRSMSRTDFLAGYAACEQDARGLVDTLEMIFRKPLGWSDSEFKHIREALAKWKERGE